MNKAFTSCAAAHFDFLEESPMIRSDASPIRPENALHICQSHAARVLIDTCWAKVTVFILVSYIPLSDIVGFVTMVTLSSSVSKRTVFARNEDKRNNCSLEISVVSKSGNYLY